MITGTLVGIFGTWHFPFWKTYPTSQTHSLPLKKALAGQTGVDEAVTDGADGAEGTDGAVGTVGTDGADGTKIFLI